MEFCKRCGGEIEFRYIGGTRRPLHVGGVYCGAGSTGSAGVAVSKFERVESYLDPNARCPVCKAPVFFYRSPHNGRVFFDDVGWPWPKHPCTDQYRGADDAITRSSGSFRFHFRGRDGGLRDVYVITALEVGLEEVTLSLRSTSARATLDVKLKLADMEKWRFTKADLEEAPSIVVLREPDVSGLREISFLCARLQSVVVAFAREI